MHAGDPQGAFAWLLQVSWSTSTFHPLQLYVHCLPAYTALPALIH